MIPNDWTLSSKRQFAAPILRPIKVLDFINYPSEIPFLTISYIVKSAFLKTFPVTDVEYFFL